VSTQGITHKQMSMVKPNASKAAQFLAWSSVLLPGEGVAPTALSNTVSALKKKKYTFPIMNQIPQKQPTRPRRGFCVGLVPAIAAFSFSSIF
jgi:hypothetical protein